MSEVGLQQAKSQRARKAICEATIGSLVEIGYSETSLNRVAAAAGFSKGALQHHFPTKEDLIAATVDELLTRTEAKSERLRAKSVESALLQAWVRFINTPAYRALMEILSAARTDKALQKRLSSDLVEWGRKLDQQSLDQYEAVSGSEEEVIMLLNMTRSFMRGLLLQERYGVSQEQTDQYVKQWISMVAPMLKFKGD
ncbi:MAG: TetR/AcrR family transcriptional regulator [Gammaproteobacteria bacterium]|jgi:AcrR family transcriptional regulator|nr:TetR/AcrR family transcriptional regulator [Gammaproteobacteria bacterium]MBT4493282.1 TetR/AcrR family transcriptional regulator [Gammaproteobacteria bacterium]MBT7371134.1 TetR/AcrR family transcriptional regulator [Gammaproteobacteria bacterium]